MDGETVMYRRSIPGLLTVFSLAAATAPVAPLGKYRPVDRKHWAFVKPVAVQPPEFQTAADRAWATNAIDAFILDRLKKEGLAPTGPADRITLIRRLFFDLTGLPPAPAEIAGFVKDKSADAYSKLVEKLLASPQYGERWGQHWLDVVRYAETDGFEYDTHRADAWRYRDYVIRAFNNDKPYDRFLMEQLAGDEISPDEDETVIAAGFNRLAPLRKNAGNQEVAASRNEVLTEMTNAVGAALLGVTLGCARCHDHKFDPIRQSDYYRIQAYFAAVHENDIVKATEDEKKAWKAAAEPVEAELKRLRDLMKKAPKSERDEWEKRIEDTQEKMPAPLPALYSVRGAYDQKTPIHLLARGDYQNKGDRVGMRPLGVLLPDNAPELPEDTPKPRTELARWVTRADNPLTARVMVNRIWHYHFGRGIVATPNDFGRMGARPTHPELLDYLATEFIRSGYSIKHMHRLIVKTNAYRQGSSTRSPLAEEKDPENRLLWKFNRRRLESEELRDAILAASGSLNRTAGGPSVMIPIEKELIAALYKPAQWQVQKDPREHDRRSVYLIAKRNLRLPLMEVFDSPDLQVSCPRRESSTHAPQALELLNGAFSNQQAERFAARLEREAGKDSRRQVDLAFRLVAGRAPSPKELRIAREYLRSGSRREFALAMFNLNAFLYVN